VLGATGHVAAPDPALAKDRGSSAMRHVAALDLAPTRGKSGHGGALGGSGRDLGKAGNFYGS
jgi:hypothetical protein